jgi:tRNA A-37 threonylcarbamoyl transferase component Bud32
LLDGRGDEAQFAAVGAAVRLLHTYDVYHADLNTHNILIGYDGRVYFVDFDRARRRSSGAWRDKNLVRLERSLNKIAAGRTSVYSPSQWRALVTAYHG